MGEHPQLDLGVIGRHKPPAVDAGHERRPDLLPLGGTDRDVLEVGVARTQPAGGGDGLVEGGVDPAGAGINERRQRIDIGALEL